MTLAERFSVILPVLRTGPAGGDAVAAGEGKPWRDRLSSPPISGLPEMGFLRRKSGTPDLRWGGGGGGGVSDSLSGYGADTPTLALPTRGRGKERLGGRLWRE